MIKVIKNNPYLFSILAIAFIVRFAGIFHDLPYSYYPDEEHFVNRAVSFGSGDFNPHWFHKPALLMYLLFFEYGVYFVIGKILGIFSSVDAFAISFFQNKGPFFLIGRLTVTLFGTATVYVLYRVGKGFFNKRTGLIAALFLALTVGHITSSQDVKADIPSAFFTVLSLYFILKLYESGELKYYLMAGAFAGFGMATKYYAVILVPTIVVAHILRLKKTERSTLIYLINKASVGAALSFLSAFFIASPYNFLDSTWFKNVFIKKIKYLIDTNYALTDPGLVSLNVSKEQFLFFKSIIHYFSVLISSDGMGEIGLIAIAGIFILLLKLSYMKTILLSFSVIFILIANKVGPFYTKPRHLSVIYPFMALFAAYFVNYLYDYFTQKKNVKKFLVVIVVLLIIPSFYRIIKYDYFLNLPNTRTMVKEWVESNIPAGTKIVFEEGDLKLSPDKEYYENLIAKAKQTKKDQFTTHSEQEYQYRLMALPDTTYKISYSRFPWWISKEKEEGLSYLDSPHDRDMGNPLKLVGVMSYEYYKNNGVEYAIVSSDRYSPYFKENSKKSENFPSYHRFYENVFKNGTLVKEFKSDAKSNRGPTIKIFKLT